MKKSVLFLLLALPALHAQDKIPLKIQFPPPQLVGTPVQVKLPNLEKADLGKKQEFMVPAGTVNLALKKPVTSSDSEPLLGSLDLITDGDKAADEGCFVELGPNKQWVQIDLGAKSDIYALWVWHFHSQARAYKDVIVQVSDDADFIDGVETVFNNDDDNSSGMGVGKDFAYIETNEGHLIPAKEGGVRGRYVRLYSAGNTTNALNHYIEVEVYGKPTP
ncbi:MAG: discoidin domain-containing protein [Verrucomicrobia bacterium]|nr:discoidin domain-containing protein [Verrucomicrobiota bacterium]